MTHKKISLDIEVLKTKTVYIATPMYGGQCSGFYAKSLNDLTSIFNNYGIRYQIYFLMNESLITRARNYALDEFMRSGYTHLLFLDSDIEFNAIDVLALLQLSEDEDKDIIGAPYPKKAISWEKVLAAANKGYAEENPFFLESYAGDFVFNPINAGDFRLDEPVEVRHMGTGFMLIQRSVFELWEEKHPEFLYYPDHVRQKNFDGSRQIMAVFQDPIIDGTHLSEDYFFCQESRNLGLRVWMCPWMQLNHIGTYKFVGNLPAVAATGHAPTADMNAVKGLK